MTATKYRVLRFLLLALWLLLALLVVGPVLAQDGSGGKTDTTLGNTQATDPQNLDDVAVRLSPLLVGAAMIERILEFIFNWVERAVLDATSTLNNFASGLTGLVQVDLHKAWDDLDKVTHAMLQRQVSEEAPDKGDPNSPDPADWPLAVLEVRLIDAKAKLNQTQDVVKKSLSSPLYVARKKLAASVISIVFGIALAFTASLRVFEPLGVSVGNWFDGPFDFLDKILAGMLMGMGTDWVHQVIGLLIQGKGALGRTAGGQYDPEQVRALASLVVQEQLANQREKLREDVLNELRPPDLTPH